jgi:NAD(P)-dependent dehydrogenase (short-subunit alcohol dehydrogenase family)
MNELNLKDNTALVTGGNRGIGRSIALALARAGARVAICGRNEETLAATAEELNRETPGAFWKVVDVRNEDQQKDLFREIGERYGHLDICVPNAGEATLASAAETSLTDWNRDIETNLTGVFITCREALNLMKSGMSGAIFPIISQAGTKPFLLRAAYCASKWGALGFTKCLALEAKEFNIRVTAICPASVATDFQKDNPRGTEWMMRADDVAECILYLLGLSDRVEIDEIILRVRKKSAK